ncbi:MAG: nucleotidyltransferase domain-containing protein [Magnetococcales bacterium]|nr:nucleotidyltransferase domain-containing protein [Magnetococcales bacterium]
MEESTILPYPVLTEFCQRRHIRRLALFGSRLSGTEGLDSDVDLLVEFQSGYAPDYFALVEMEGELSGLLAGRPVDLRTPDELSRYFRQQVMETARVQYVF